MRVLHVVRQFHPMVGGLENFVLALAKRQRAVGIDARVLTLARLFSSASEKLRSNEMVETVPVERIGFIGGRRAFFAPSVLLHLDGADIVHVHAVDFFAEFLAHTARAHGKPLVLSTHGGYFHTDFAAGAKNVLFHTLTKASLAKYKAVFASSYGDFERFREVCADRLSLIDNGVDVSKFAGLAAPSLTPTLIYIGRLAANKGLHELITTFGHLKQLVPDAKLHIVGSDFDGTLVSIRSLIGRSLAADSIHVHCGLDDAGVARLIAESSIFVSASRYEGFGLTLVEAMSAGLIPVVSRIPSFQHIMGAAGVGCVTDFARPQIAALAIADCMKSLGTSYADARSAVMKASATYSWERVERQFAEAYEQVLGYHRRPLLGVRVNVNSRAEVAKELDNAIAQHCGKRVAFANAHTLNLAAADADFRQTLQSFTVLNDGLGVDIASRLKFGRPFDQNLNGTDFIPYYLSATRRSLRIALIGSTAEVVEAAAERFKTIWPHHQFVTWRNGFFGSPREAESAADIIRAAQAEVVLVGMGNPAQEFWIRDYGDRTGATLLFGVGALFDFTAGRVRRAPQWVRNVRLEWGYRLLQEPRRMGRRYLRGNLEFLVHALRDSRAGYQRNE